QQVNVKINGTLDALAHDTVLSTQSLEVMHTKERQHILINIIIYAGFTLIKNSKKQKKIIDQKNYKLYVY
ncbi:hypothetical protein PDJ94_26175, partial [Bacillus cereus group sp. TH244-1LC]|uniref:hypothetical protein n=1 Tax=Bacillus cereus group sp. TH244-1LC TaxID=3018044 RepID=UPI0022E5DCBF